jgi:predicted PurR-regulated permease PerM
MPGIYHITTYQKSMGVLPFSEDQKLLLVMSGIVILAIIAFWPIIDMFVWAGAIAVVLIPLHHRLSRTVPPSTSATFITIWIILGILLVMSAAASIMYNNLDYIGGMVSAIVKGFDNSAITFLLPKFTQEQLANMPNTLVQMLLHTLMSLTENIVLALLRIVILFLSLSLLIFYGEGIWGVLTGNLSPKLGAAVSKMSEITSNTVYALIVVQVSGACISFLIAIPFFYFFGYGNVLLFATMIGIAQLIPLVGASVFILFFMLYLLALGDIRGAAVMLFIGYPLMSGWIDFYYRPVMMGKRTAIHPVLMMIAFFAGVPFMGFVGFIAGPVLMALLVTGYKLYAEEVSSHETGRATG